MLSEQPSSCSLGVLFGLSGDAVFDLLFEFSVDLPILSCLYVYAILCCKNMFFLQLLYKLLYCKTSFFGV